MEEEEEEGEAAEREEEEAAEEREEGEVEEEYLARVPDRWTEKGESRDDPNRPNIIGR